MTSHVPRLLKPLLPVLVLVLQFLNGGAQTISPRFFGQNAWMPDTIGSNVLNGKIHTKWSKVAESGVKTVRFGGISADRDRPTDFQYIKMIDSIRARGMEPIIQVSYHDGDYTAAQAAQLVQYINGTKGRGIKYWIIGNEPDLEYGYTSASQVAAYIRPFASAMKAVDPSIKIIGPETAWYNQSILHGLTTPGGPSDITGVDSAGRYYVDIISFHTYPFNGTQTRASMIGKLTANPGFDTNLGTLSARIASCNATHGRSGPSALRMAVTEANVNYQNSSTDNLNGTGVNSFVGGQFVAEMYGIGLKNGVDIMSMWSVVEGNSTALNIGYLDRTTGNKKPAFHHLQMMADHFSGNYVSSTSTQTNVKVFSSQSSSLTTVLIMNQDTATNFSYAVRLNTALITATNALKINVNANIAQNYYNILPSQSSVLLQFNAQGNIVKKVTYTIAQALANLSPTVSVYTPTVPLAVSPPVNNTPSFLQTLCSGNSTTLSATSGTNTIKWYASATSTAVISTGTLLATGPLMAGTNPSMIVYYAQAVNSTTVSVRTPVTITINPVPVITVNSGVICQGQSFTLNPSGAASYTISGGSSVVTPTMSSSYPVSGTSSAGCVSPAPAVAQVTVNSLPVVSVNSATLCAGQVFSMLPSGAATYTFSNGSSTVIPASSANYSVSGTSSAGCISAQPAIAHVSVTALPVVTVNSGSICAGSAFSMAPAGALTYTFSSGTATVTPVLNSSYTVTGSDGSGCISLPAISNVTVNSVSVTVNSGGICQGHSFTLSPGGAVSYTISGGSAVVSPVTTSTYLVKGTNAQGCISPTFAVATVTVHPLPAIAVNSGSVCSGSAFTMVPTGAASYTVSGSSFVVSPLATTLYSVTGTSMHGCTSGAWSKVVVLPQPIVTVGSGTICKGGAFTLTPAGASGYTFSSGSQVVTPLSTTSYSVWGSTAGCSSKAAVAVVNVKPKRSCSTGLVNEINLLPASHDTISVTGNMYAPDTSASTGPMPGAVTPGFSEEQLAKQLTVYPNPNNGEFFVVVEQECRFTVSDISGNVIRSGQLRAGTSQVTVTDLPAGIYVVKVEHDGISRSARVIRQ